MTLEQHIDRIKNSLTFTEDELELMRNLSKDEKRFIGFMFDSHGKQWKAAGLSFEDAMRQSLSVIIQQRSGF